MPRFLLYSALALYFSVFSATAADRYGEWLLEHLSKRVRPLSGLRKGGRTLLLSLHLLVLPKVSFIHSFRNACSKNFSRHFFLWSFRH
jgi:hypothetical protein